MLIADTAAGLITSSLPPQSTYRSRLMSSAEPGTISRIQVESYPILIAWFTIR
jgi:hypothetical protein